MRAHEQTPEDHGRRGQHNRPAQEEQTTAEAVSALQRNAGNAAVADLLAQRSQVDRVLRSAGSPLPSPVRSEMQSRLGADFSDVRVHTDSAADASARSVNAQAYTSGSHIVFRRGQYAPESSGGKHVLAHELTHVLQQRSGPVAGTDHGGGLRVSDPSDSYERAAEANAHRVMSGAEPIQRETDGTANDDFVIQRNIGVELEDTNWQVTAEEGAGLEKFTPLAHGRFFQLQAEFAGADRFGLEMVTITGGVADDQELKEMADGMTALAKRLKELGAEYGAEGFSTTRLESGEQGYRIVPDTPGQSFSPSMQVTVGVPLRAVPRLLAELKDLDVEEVRILGGSLTQSLSVEENTQRIEDTVRSRFPDAEPELVGFIALVESYVHSGRISNFKTFPKALYSVMARTDFAEMFNILPETARERILSDLEGWVTNLVALTNVDAEGPLAKTVFDDPQDIGAPRMKITTTRGQWLREMLPREGKQGEDLLAADFRTPEGELDEAKVQARAGQVQEEVRLSWMRRVMAWLAKKFTWMKGLLSGTRPAPVPPDPLAARPGMEFRPLTGSRRPNDELEAVLKDLYQGMGGLGGKTDVVKYEADEEETKAVILEIRRPRQVTDIETLADRPTQMDLAVRNAIEANKGPYQNRRTEGQTAAANAAEQRRRELAPET